MIDDRIIVVTENGTVIVPTPYIPLNVGTVTTASYAETASYALNGGTGGEGGGPTGWNDVTDKPTGLVSSSAQITFPVTSSHALTADVANAVSWDSVSGVPVLVSSSAQIDYTGIQNQPTAIPTASHLHNAAHIAVGTSPATAGVIRMPNNARLNARAFDDSANVQIFYVTTTDNIELGSYNYGTRIVGSTVGLWAGGSPQLTVTDGRIEPWTDGIFYLGTSTKKIAGAWIDTISGSLVGTASYATTAATAISASWAPSSEGESVAWSSVTSKPAGIVSQSAQISTWTVATASFVNASDITLGTLNTSRLPSQISVTGVSASLLGTSSWSARSVSASYAASTMWSNVTAKPVGLVSSSAQIATWTSATASFVAASNVNGTLSNSNLPTQINITGYTGSLTGSLSGASINTEFTSYREKINALGNQSGTMTVNYLLGNVVTCTLTGNVTTLTITNVPASTAATLTIIATQNGTGNYDIAFSNTKWVGGVAPEGSGANDIDVYHLLTVDGGSTWLGNVSLDFS